MGFKQFVICLAFAILISLLILRLFAPELVVGKPLGIGLEIAASGLLAVTLAVVTGAKFDDDTRYNKEELDSWIDLILPRRRASLLAGPGTYLSVVGGLWLACIVDIAYRMDGLIPQRSPTYAAIAAVLLVCSLLAGWKVAVDCAGNRSK